MRLDFNVLWVDDQPDQLDAQLIAISRHMAGEGFFLNVKKCQSLQEVRTLISEDVFQDEVDLILVDWNLGGDLRGQHVIAEIRQYIPYKDLIFYSSLTTVNDLRQAASSASADGIFCTSKNAIVDEVAAVFDTLIKKVLDLDHTRGIVMGATSDIDHMTVRCLSAIEKQGADTERAELLAKAKELIANTQRRLAKNASTLESATSVAELLAMHAVFTANDRLRVLNMILGTEKYNDRVRLKDGIANYIRSVVPLRNDLGHVVLIPAGRTAMILDDGGKQISIEEMRELRKLLLDVRGELKEFKESVDTTESN